MAIPKKWTLRVLVLLMLAISIIAIFANRGVIAMKYGDTNNDALNVSIISLIAEPEKYDGKNIRVRGFLNVEYEAMGIYLNEEDYKNCVTKNAVWLNFDYDKLGTDFKQIQRLNKKYVDIEGVFNRSYNGHFGMYSGTIENVYAIKSI